MCEPATLSLAISATSAIAGLAGSISSVNAQADYQRDLAIERQRQIDENAELARKSYEINTAQIDKATQQAQEAAGEKVFENRIDALKARSTASVAAGEAGVSGLSVQALLDDFSAQEGRFNSAVRRNLEGEQAQGESDKAAAQALAEGRIQSVTPFIAAPIESPDYFGAALRIGQAGVDYYAAQPKPVVD